MSRRFALVALWAVFAAAAVGAGFGAVGLAGSPFTGPEAATPIEVSAPLDTAASPQPSDTRSTATPTGSPRPDETAGSVVRGFSTAAGYVGARCQDGLVSVTASPAVGWEIDDIDAGARREARVRFEESGDGDGEVEVEVSCADGTPVFHRSTDDRGGDGDGGGG